MAHTLVLLRHGESEWNAKNLFTGWVDVGLTDKGRAEAVRGGEQMRAAGLDPNVVHTSLQRRAINTAYLALDAADRHWIPVRRSWRLNERHYGALQGKDKKQTLEQYGEEQFMLWRRSFDVPPPPLDDDDQYSQVGQPQYADLGEEMPRTECLKDVIARFLPYWEASIVPDLRAGHTVLVAAHGNSLRALVKHLDGISDDDIAGLNIPTGMPLVSSSTTRSRRRSPGVATSTRTRQQRPPRLLPSQGRYGPADRGRVLAGHHEDDAVGHGDGVIGDPLVVATEQRDVDGRLDAVLPAGGQQLGEAGAPQPVHLLVVAAERDRGLDVTGDDDLGDSARPCPRPRGPSATWSAAPGPARRGRALGAGRSWRRAPRGRPSAPAR